jgi:hypothetical protein
MPIDVVNAESLATNFLLMGLMASLAARDDAMWEVIRGAFDGADLLADSAALSGSLSPEVSRLVHLNLEALREMAFRNPASTNLASNVPKHES